ncbi:two-component system histidine kinase PnpS [Mechercharimyces sp. CAU 1602]|uniref:two-component system histidine kinase PnpS n=1 Tax=Mechercharimyces sp. CAU 1602 TaxID=2973933 RepID=UPI002161418E|nr:cell wall metabolism sensor histidine kinase WalK [Mechercharimyces sp. CAU 1602]MCS1351602.1 cell wall metabolism sensor histidine kinase WalK [Mechercharimyces sp. CAU 1602]
MKTLRKRLTTQFLWAISISILVTGIIVISLAKSSYNERIEERLLQEANMIVTAIDRDDVQHASWQEAGRTYSQILQAEVSLFSSKEESVADESERKRDSASEKRQVQRVFESGESYTSSTLWDQSQVVIVPILNSKQEVTGAVRIELVDSSFGSSILRYWIYLLLVGVIAVMLAVGVSALMAYGLTKPIEEVTRIATDIAQKNFQRIVTVQSEDEIGRLGQAINRMASSHQKQMASVRKSKRRLTTVIETMDSGLLMVNGKGEINLANRALEEMLGVENEQVIGTDVQMIPYPHEIRTLLNRCIEQGERIREEIHLYLPEDRIIEVRVVPIGGQNERLGVVAVLHDITAIRRLEKMRTEFVANVSHELKTPVTSLRGFTETLLDGAIDDKETAREFLNIVLGESLRLERLISDLLDLSRIESKKLTLERDWVQVDELVVSTVRSFRTKVEKRQQDLQLCIENPFPVYIDRDRFEQILLNLLSNAIAYTPPGGQITVEVIQIADEWRLEVKDTGIGIPEEDLSRIFERFYRVDKARSRESGGTGLGLAIVKHLVEAHEGKLEVKSSVGEGTTFSATFPLVFMEHKEKSSDN